MKRLRLDALRDTNVRRMKVKWKSVAPWLSGLVALVAVATFVGYHYSPRLLCIDSGEVKAGALVVLGGDPIGRPTRAAELFNSQAAPVVVVSGGPGGCEEMDAVLKQCGVPGHAIVWEEHSLNTHGNAEFSVAMLRKAGITNAIVVTSWYHSRRALNCFRKAAPEMQFYSRPSYYGWDRSEWSRNGIGVHVRAEYIKLLGYWVRYGIAPF